MTTYYIKSDKKPNAVSGTLTADIQTFGLFNGVATRFITNGKQVTLRATHKLNETEENSINFTFPATIENKRYEFLKGGPVQPPTFAQEWEDECGGHWYRPHSSKEDAGYVEFNFDIENGTLNAKFHFTVLENPTGDELLVAGEVKDFKGLEHINCSLVQDEPRKPFIKS